MAIGFQIVQLDWENYGIELLDILTDTAKKAKVSKEATMEAWETLCKIIWQHKNEEGFVWFLLGDKYSSPKIFVGVITHKKRIEFFFTIGTLSHLDRAQKLFLSRFRSKQVKSGYFQGIQDLT